MLSQAWLTRFQEIHTWDIDPWSERLFGWRHGKALRRAGISWVHHNHDAWLDPQAWEMSGPDTLYWFDNVLGQLRFVLPLAQARQQVEQLKSRLGRVVWGSVHDRYSGPLHGSQNTPAPWRSMSGVDLNDTAAQRWLQSWGAEGEWLDHLTENVLPPQAGRRLLCWPISRARLHWVEAGWVAPD